MTVLFIGARMRAWGQDGAPLAGGLVYTYEAGTTTPKVAYFDAEGLVPHSNPFVLDANGEADVWLQGTYKINIEYPNGVQVPGYPVDKVPGSAVSYPVLIAPDGASLVGYSTDTVQSALDRAESMFATIAALRLNANTRITSAGTNGYYAARDGGAAFYVKDASDTTTADNGGSVIVDAALNRWKLNLSTVDVYVEVFGAKGDGTDDRTQIQACFDFIVATGRAGVARFKSRTYGISAALSQVRGVSAIGVGQGMTYLLSDDVDGTRIKWLGAGTGKMLRQRNRWIGTVENIIFDGNNLADMAIESIGVCSSFYRGVTVEKMAAGSYAWYLTTTGALYPDGTTQWPSCALNLFEKCIIRDVAGPAMCWDGTVNGANATVGAVTQNVLMNCRFQGGNNSYGLVMNKCCDTNWSYGGEYTSVSGASGCGVVLNFSAVNNETFGNHFYGGVMASATGLGIALQCTNNASFNACYGVYMTFCATRVNNVSSTGKVVLRECGDLSGFTYSAAAGVAVGASPYTYTNTNPYAVEFQFWGGTVSAVSRIRDGMTSGVGTGAACYLLQPGDGVTITHTGAPNALLMPQ